VHFDDSDTSIEETVDALEDLVSEGKICHYGIGHLPVLMELSTVTRDSRKKLLPLCQKYGVGAIAFSVTGRGLLTGRFKNGKKMEKKNGKEKKFEPGDIRNIDPLFHRECFQSGL